MSEVSTAVAWLERGYDKREAFESPDPFNPVGIFQIKPDHEAVCPCAPGGES